MDNVRPRKSSLWLAPLAIIIVPVVVISYIAGFLWAWIYGGFAKGDALSARLSGFRSTEEIIEQVVREKLENKDGQ